MTGRGDRDQLDCPDCLPFQFRMIRQHRPANAEIGAAVDQAGSHCAQRLDIQPEGHGGEHGTEPAQHLRRHDAGDHHIGDQRNIAFQPGMQALRLGQQGVDIVGHPARFGKQPLARLGQHRLARSLAREQHHAKLRLHLRHAITDGGDRPPHPPCGGAEAPLLGHGEEDAQLVECWIAQLHCSDFLNILANFIAVIR